MPILWAILAGLAIAAGAGGTLIMAVMLLAGGANSTPEQIRAIKLWLVLVAVGGVACLTVGVALVCKSHPLLGGSIGVLPMIAVLVGVIWISLPR